MAVPIPTEERFWDKVSPEPMSGCWLWTAATTDGYGRFFLGRVNGKKKTGLAHIFSYNLFIGKVPQGLQLDHLCRLPCCVNPRHLDPVTSRENSRRGIGWPLLRLRGADRTHCKRGHDFSVVGRYSPGKGKSGRGQCKACAALIDQKRWKTRRVSKCIREKKLTGN